MKFAAIIASAVFLAAGTVGVSRADDAPRVLVVPFSALNVSESQQWISKGVQENVVAVLGRSGDFSPIAFQGQVIVEDNATAARLGRTAQSPLVVRGAAQAVGNSIRLTAQLIDSKSGDTVRTALVTGPADNLLKMEDDLAAQLQGEVTATSAPVTTASGPAAPVVPPAPQPQVIIITQPSAPAYSDYSQYAGYGAYPYGYESFYYPGLYPIIVTHMGGDRHDHDHDHDHHPGGGRGGMGSGGGGFHPVQVGHGSFNSAALPNSTGNLLPIPARNILPAPTQNAVPVPRAGMPSTPSSGHGMFSVIAPSGRGTWGH